MFEFYREILFCQSVLVASQSKSPVECLTLVELPHLKREKIKWIQRTFCHWWTGCTCTI